MRRHVLPFVVLLCACPVAAASAAEHAVSAGVPPASIAELRVREHAPALEVVRRLPEGRSFRAYLVSYRSSGGLEVKAFVAEPKQAPPAAGFPVLVANHGYHPDPPRYGRTAEGIDRRPGDYYRDVPELYAAHGFLVVMPDYRGHADSQGLEFTRGFLASAYYTEDVVALLPALHRLRHADATNVFMWGHSLGGEVTLRALLATRGVRAASLWSTVGGDVWEQTFHYSRRPRSAPDGADVEKREVARLQGQIRALGEPYDWAAREPWAHLEWLSCPVILHHAIGDPGAKYDWSERLAQRLYAGGHAYRFYTYEGGDHLLQGEARARAVERDVAFFRAAMRPSVQP